MLVLSRKVGESLVMDDDIEVVVVEIRGDKVRLGVTLPVHKPLYRKEVYEAVRGSTAPKSAPAPKPPPPVVATAPQTVASAEVVAKHLDAIRAALLAAAADGVRVTITAGG